MSAAEEAGEASVESKVLFAAGIGVVAAGNAWTKWRSDRALEADQ